MKMYLKWLLKNKNEMFIYINLSDHVKPNSESNWKNILNFQYTNIITLVQLKQNWSKLFLMVVFSFCFGHVKKPWNINKA